MSIPRTTSWGLALAAATAVISGVSIFINGLVVTSFKDPVALSGARNAIVGLGLLAILLATGGLGEIRGLDRRRAGGLLVIAVVGGSVPFILFFSGLAQASGPGAAIIHKTLFIWVAAMGAIFLRESLGLAQVVALAALFTGVLLVGPGGTPGTGLAEALILGATLLWAVEVIVARRLLAPGDVSVRLAATARMALGAVLIAVFLLATGRIAAVAAFTLTQWAIVAGTALLLFGYVTTWYAALQRAPASLVTSVLVGGALITAGLSVARTGALPASSVEVGLVLVAVGIAATMRSVRPTREHATVRA